MFESYYQQGTDHNIGRVTDHFVPLISDHLLVSQHFMRGRELSTLVVILSIIMGIHFQVIKLEHRVLYSHYSFFIDGKSYFLSYFCI